VKRPAARRRTSVSSPLRARALRSLEACERGLADAYRALPARVLSRADCKRLADLHERHAALLADYARGHGGRSARTPDDLWITEPTISGMRLAEEKAFTTYRDHLATLAPSASQLIRARIMPDHYRAAEHLARVAARRGRKWRHSIHRRPSLQPAA